LDVVAERAEQPGRGGLGILGLGTAPADPHGPKLHLDDPTPALHAEARRRAVAGLRLVVDAGLLACLQERTELVIEVEAGDLLRPPPERGGLGIAKARIGGAARNAWTRGKEVR